MSLLARVKSDPLLRHNAVFFVGSLLVAVLNYLYNPIVGRMLTVSEFGEVSVYFSLATQIAVLLGIFNLVAIHLASNHEHRSGRNVLLDVYAVVFWAQIAVIAVVLLCSPILARVFQFTSVVPFFLLAVTTYLALPYALLTSVAQGKKQFVKLSLGSLLQSGVKLVVAVLLVSLGGRVLGALGALLVAQLCSMYYFSGGKWREVELLPRVRPVFDTALWSELRYALLVLVATGTIAVLYTSDTVVVKYFFPPNIAGEYSGISIIGKILFFATASISAVLLPSVTLAQGKSENFRILRNSALFVGVIGGAGYALMVLFPELIIKLMIGEKYLPFAHLLPSVALMMLLASFINLLFMYLLALRRYALVFVALSGIILLIVLISFAHTSVSSLVEHFQLVDGVILALLISYLTYEHLQGKTTAFDRRPTL